MITLDRTGVAVLVAIAVFWVAVAVWATIVAAGRSIRAHRWIDEAQRLAALIATAPAMPLIVDKDGRVDHGERLGRWLGLAGTPRSLDDLADPTLGLAAVDVEALGHDVAATRRAGRGFSRAVTMTGSGRVLLVRGQPDRSAGGVTLWFIDMTDSEREIARLGAEVLRLRQLVDVVSTLIEVAPFPMWHRGHALSLSLVNGAYVRAVDGESMQHVVREGLELLEPGKVGGPPVPPPEYDRPGAVSVRAAPAIVAGERRTMRIVDVSLGEAGVAGYAIDIEELEEARADLRRFAGAQRAMLDRLSSAVVQFGADYGLIFYNRNFLRLFPIFEPEWLADQPDFDRMLERLREEDRVPEARDFPSWKAERRAWFSRTEASEENWLLPDGTHLRIVAQPLPDGGLLLGRVDRTEHLQLASARDTLLRVRTATFDNLFEAVAVFAADGRMQIWNARFTDIWELTDAELALKPHVDALVEAIAPKLADPSRAGLVRELVRLSTVERQQRAGRLSLEDGRHFEFAVVPLPDGNALFALLDITASRGIEAALRDRNEGLEEADRIKSAFVANMSYELRVPLTSIAGFAEMLQGGYAGDLGETARDYIGAIVSAVARLRQLIGDVLDLGQSEAGTLPLAREAVAAGPLAKAAYAAAFDFAVARAIDLRCDIPPDPVAFEGDSMRMRQCLDHLLRNAITYTQQGGSVLLKVDHDARTIAFTVSDNGPGIPPPQREQIGRGLSRLNVDAVPGGSGGIGLPLVRQLAEAHGGDFVLTCEDGLGTTATILLPICTRAGVPAYDPA